MADLLVAVAEGEARFNPDQLVAAALRQWPDADAVAINGPELASIADLMTMQLTIRDGQQVVIVEFHTGNKAIDAEGDDDLAAEFLALLTQNMPIPDNAIALMNWADDIVTLRQNMTADEVRALRDDLPPVPDA